MSRVARRKELSPTPPAPLAATVAEPMATPSAVPTAPIPSPLTSVDGHPIRLVHLVAELAPFARSGGLGEAVNSLARFQAASGIPTSIVMPLYTAARENASNIEPVGPPFTVQVGPRAEP
ncbi:MAG: glycogen/starch synthase, partial [Gemmatimonadaceae bacterium]